MSAEQIIAEIEWLEHLFGLSDERLVQVVDLKAEKQADNETYINEPWPRLPRQEWLEQLYVLPDNRALQTAEWPFEKQKESETHSNNSRVWIWFLLWKRDVA
jgi:hypothetical protein